MCDGVTQGQPGMELSLFSRDVIAMATAVACHDMFDAALMLGVCDKIVPGLLIGALHFGHLPTVFVPAGPMTSGLSNNDKAKVREQAPRAWWAATSCWKPKRRPPTTARHLHLLRHGQQQPDAAGGHGPACARHAFVNPGGLREALDARGRAHGAGHHRALGASVHPIGHVVDERAIVNAMVALLATGGSTNHLIHWVAVARAAGITSTGTTLPRCRRRGAAAGPRVPQRQRRREPVPGRRRPGYVIRELLDAGLMHADVLTVRARGLREYTSSRARNGGPCLVWRARRQQGTTASVRARQRALQCHGRPQAAAGQPGPQRDQGVGRAGRPPCGAAPARVFDTQDDLHGGLQAGELDRDVVVWCAGRARRPTACPSCTSSRRRWPCCKARASRWRW
jgi:phosphogluconate dehydratase